MAGGSSLLFLLGGPGQLDYCRDNGEGARWASSPKSKSGDDVAYFAPPVAFHF